MTFSNLPAGYVRLKYISPVLDPISDEYVADKSTHTIGRLRRGRFVGDDAVDVCAPFQRSPGGEFFFEFDTGTGKMVLYASTVFTLISERLGDASIADEVQAQVEQPAQPTPSKGWIIGRVCDGEIDTVSIVYSDECDVDHEIVDFATLQPDATYVKMEIKAYVKAKVEAVWS